MKNVLFLLMACFSVGCATSTRQTDALMKKHGFLPSKSKIQGVPLIKQERNHCGPASMAMMLRHAGKDVSLNELTSQMYTKKMQGTFQADMLSSARRQGMLAIPVNDMVSLITEISAGHPVVVFQNLGLSWWPLWHYAVVTGHNFHGPDILLHTGKDKFKKMDMFFFERTWKLGGHWGLLILRPDQLSEAAGELPHVQAAAILEDLGKTDEAQVAYKTILQRWPQSLAALIGLGNVTYAKQEFKKSVSYLELATKYHPNSAISWHNMAIALGALGEKTKAKRSSLKAMSLVDEVSRSSFKEGLKVWLGP